MKRPATGSSLRTHARADAAVKAKLPGMIVIDAAVGLDFTAKTESCSGTLANPEVTYSRWGGLEAAATLPAYFS
jgi:hypothetical protein